MIKVRGGQQNTKKRTRRVAGKYRTVAGKCRTDAEHLEQGTKPQLMVGNLPEIPNNENPLKHVRDWE